MKKIDFIKSLTEKLQFKTNDFGDDTRFDSFAEWDSWAKLEVMTYVDESFKIVLTAEDLSEIETFGDLINKIGIAKF